MSAASPRLMCIACEQVEVTLLEVLCPSCSAVLDAGQDLDPPRAGRVQIGPLDVASPNLDQVAAATGGALTFPRPVSAGRGLSIPAT